MVALDDIRRVALGLPDAYEQASYDSPAELITESWRLRASKSLVKTWDAFHDPAG